MPTGTRARPVGLYLASRLRGGYLCSRTPSTTAPSQLRDRRGGATPQTENNCHWADVYGLVDEVEVDVPLASPLTYNPRFALRPPRRCTWSGEYEYRWMHYQRSEFISWAIGVAMGRYSVDVPGLVLADQALSSTTSATASPVLQPAAPTMTA